MLCLATFWRKWGFAFHPLSALTKTDKNFNLDFQTRIQPFSVQSLEEAIWEFQISTIDTRMLTVQLYFMGWNFPLTNTGRYPFGEMKWQISSQKKEGKKSNPHRICPTEKSKLLSIIKRKPSSTARLKDTTQTRTRSISWHDTNRPSSFASEQATADWIAISRGLV